MGQGSSEASATGEVVGVEWTALEITVGVVFPPDETEGAMAVPSQNSIARIVSDEKGERQRRTLPPFGRG
jgi:hypothetical protein